MNYNSIRSFRTIDNLLINPKTKDGKNICFAFFSENDTFLNSIDYIPIRKSLLKHVFVPTINKPFKIYMDQDYRTDLIHKKLRPVRGTFEEFDQVKNKNFYLDYTLYESTIRERYKLTKFNMGRGFMFMNNILSTLNLVPDEYDVVLFYSINVNKPFSKKLLYRKVWPIYSILNGLNKNSLHNRPFDKVMVHLHNGTNIGRIVQIYDKDDKINISRIKSILLKIKPNESSIEEIDNELEDKAEDIANVVGDATIPSSTISNKTKSKLKDIVYNHIKTTKSIPMDDDDDESQLSPSNKLDIALRASVTHVIGDEDTQDDIISKANMDSRPEFKKEVILNQFAENALVKHKVKTSAESPFISSARPDILTDFQNPKHILEKRHSDFKEILLEDIVDAFKVLETKSSPLKIKSVKVKTTTSPPSELRPKIIDRYNIDLVDDQNQTHSVTIELPHLTKNGTFLVNGQEKIIVNQMVTHPIFFFKPYYGKFTSAYSSINIHSKILSKTSYLIAFMANYKFPLILWLGYKVGFDAITKQYGITYRISDKSETDTDIELPGKSFVIWEADNEAGRQLMESLRYSASSFDKAVEKTDLLDQETWKYALEKYIDNRNCIYLLDQVWHNIVTPIEKKILEAKGEPTNVNDILHYISTQVVRGRVDDRNSIEKQRIRTSEVFTSLVQKQIFAAYNEYESKKMGGDPNARLYINPTKTFSEVITSQNVQTLENINPMEEISLMTKITPIGIGGIVDKKAVTEKSMNIHNTYFGSVDPLETPDGEGVGIQQQLSIGSNVTNIRGMFNIKSRDQVFPSEILSTGPASIPFVESNDGVRITQASGQMKQALPLLNPEVPAVQSGYEGIFTPLLSDNYIKKSPVNGTILEITASMIVIKDDVTDKVHYVDIKPVLLKSGQGKNGLSTFKTKIKIGQKVNKDDIIAEGANIKDGVISNGVNMLVGFMPWKGYNFEDGMVISESASKKLSSVHVEEERTYLQEGEDVIFIGNIGDKFKKGDIILTYTSAIDDVESYRHLRTDGGEIVSIEIYSNLPEENIPEKLLPYYQQTKARHEALHGKYSIGSFREKGEKFEGILVHITISQVLDLIRGDKLNNRSFNKGVVAVIVPDNEMPKTPWGEPLEMLYAPLSVIGRMITGQIMEMHCGLISRTLAKLMTEKSRKEFTEKYIKVIQLLDGTKGFEYSKRVIKMIIELSDKNYEELKAKVEKDRFIPLIFPPFKSPPRENILEALTVLDLKPKYPLFIPEYNKTTQPVAVGYIMVMRLEHLSDKKLHARGIGPYVSRTMAPTGGKKRSGGQAVGEYDSYSLLAWDCPTIIDEFLGPLSDDHVTKNEMISEIIQNGETNYKAPKSTPVKDLFGYMMLAVHLEAR